MLSKMTKLCINVSPARKRRRSRSPAKARKRSRSPAKARKRSRSRSPPKRRRSCSPGRRSCSPRRKFRRSRSKSPFVPVAAPMSTGPKGGAKEATPTSGFPSRVAGMVPKSKMGKAMLGGGIIGGLSAAQGMMQLLDRFVTGLPADEQGTLYSLLKNGYVQGTIKMLANVPNPVLSSVQFLTNLLAETSAGKTVIQGVNSAYSKLRSSDKAVAEVLPEKPTVDPSLAGVEVDLPTGVQ